MGRRGKGEEGGRRERKNLRAAKFRVAKDSTTLGHIYVNVLYHLSLRETEFDWEELQWVFRDRMRLERMVTDALNDPGRGQLVYIPDQIKEGILLALDQIKKQEEYTGPGGGAASGTLGSRKNLWGGSGSSNAGERRQNCVPGDVSMGSRSSNAGVPAGITYEDVRMGKAVREAIMRRFEDVRRGVSEGVVEEVDKFVEERMSWEFEGSGRDVQRGKGQGVDPASVKGSGRGVRTAGSSVRIIKDLPYRGESIIAFYQFVQLGFGVDECNCILECYFDPIPPVMQEHIKRCGVECVTGQANPCSHVLKVCTIAKWFWRKWNIRFPLPCAKNFRCGNPWMRNSVMLLSQYAMGRGGRQMLERFWGVTAMERKVIGMKVVGSMMKEFFDSRSELGRFGDYFGEPVDINKVSGNEFGDIKTNFKKGQWYRLKFLSEDVDLSACGWEERAWHGFPIECLSSMLRIGLLPSSSERVGSRNNVVEPGIFCCSDDHMKHAQHYCTLVPSGDNLYWSFMWELSVDRYQCIKQPRRYQWTQPVGSVCRKALWVRVINFQDIPNGEEVQAIWQPMYECV